MPSLQKRAQNLHFAVRSFSLMTATSSPASAFRYPIRTIARADCAMRCAPLKLDLFVAMVAQSVPLSAIAGSSGIQNHYTRRILSELRIEAELLWLIQVGILRREVDGQGLTDSFRLTPLGRLLVDRWQNKQGGDCNTPTWNDHLRNWVNRWIRAPF
jgi:hypothetical protein